MRRKWIAILGVLCLCLSAGAVTASASDWTAMFFVTTQPLYGIWGSGANDVFAVGACGASLHYTGTAWTGSPGHCSHMVPYAFTGIWGSGANNVFAVGGWSHMWESGGMIKHYNGSTWTEMASGTTAWLTGIWGSAANDVFAVGKSGTILHYNGSAWTAMASGTTEWLSGIWGSAANDVFAVGGSGTILHYNGSAWTPMASGTTERLSDIWGSASNDVFAVGGSGTILHYNGSAWTPMVSGTTEAARWHLGERGQQRLCRRRVGHDPAPQRLDMDTHGLRHDGGSLWHLGERGQRRLRRGRP